MLCKEGDQLCTHKRSLKACSELVFWDEFAATDDRIAATMKIRLKFRTMVPSNQVRLDVRRLRNENDAQEYERNLEEIFGELNDSDDPEKNLD